MAALLLFVLEPFPADVIAIGVMVALMVFGRWTGVTPETGVSGLANPATVTVLSMFIISEGVKRMGLFQRLGSYIEGVTGDDEGRQPGAAVGLVTPFSGFMSNTASVALMVPVALEVASGIGSNPFSFVLAVTFAASTAFMTPMGYQTNLLVYGPGGYRFSDYLKFGGPLQVLLAGVTTAGIAVL